MRVTIRVETHTGEVEVSEESLRNTWAGDGEAVDAVLERAVTKIHAAYGLTLTDTTVARNAEGEVTLSDTNRALLDRAYDDGVGGTFSLIPSDIPGYFEGHYDGDYVMEATEVNGILYSVCSNSGGGMVSVLVGNQICSTHNPALAFQSIDGARTYIQGLAAQ